MNTHAPAQAKDLRALFDAIRELRTDSDCDEFFADLCTPAELRDMADRWKAAALIDRGVTYREIYEKTGVSTATVTRVARALYNGRGGYRKVLDRLKHKR